MMTHRERILAVYRNEVPDQIPFMLDLSHWFYHAHRMPWDLSQAYEKPEYDLIDYHREKNVGFYMPNLGAFFQTRYPADIRSRVEKSPDGRSITWSFDTPLGSISRTRVWEDVTYAWAVSRWGVQSESDLRILAAALANRAFTPDWPKYRAWTDAVGDLGVVYLPAGYSAMGQLLNYWMGVEATLFAAVDWPNTLRQVIDQINRNNLQLIDLLADSPAEIIMMGDNFSSDIQPPNFFRQWSAEYYAEAIRRLHNVGKCVAVHIDGRLAGALEMIRDVGADCADAVTPRPMGDLTPAECRRRAGRDFILSGGVSPDLWLPDIPESAFIRAVEDWLALKSQCPRLIANAGDQVPPNADENRITLFRDLTASLGRYD
jgi:hypothetical protein